MLEFLRINLEFPEFLLTNITYKSFVFSILGEWFSEIAVYVHYVAYMPMILKNRYRVGSSPGRAPPQVKDRG